VSEGVRLEDCTGNVSGYLPIDEGEEEGEGETFEGSVEGSEDGEGGWMGIRRIGYIDRRRWRWDGIQDCDTPSSSGEYWTEERAGTVVGGV
jgi:hypothetical protein